MFNKAIFSNAITAITGKGNERILASINTIAHEYAEAVGFMLEHGTRQNAEFAHKALCATLEGALNKKDAGLKKSAKAEEIIIHAMTVHAINALSALGIVADLSGALVDTRAKKSGDKIPADFAASMFDAAKSAEAFITAKKAEAKAEADKAKAEAKAKAESEKSEAVTPVTEETPEVTREQLITENTALKAENLSLQNEIARLMALVIELQTPAIAPAEKEQIALAA